MPEVRSAVPVIQVVRKTSFSSRIRRVCAVVMGLSRVLIEMDRETGPVLLPGAA